MLSETKQGINEGMPVESYGAELELLLNPPSVPGLTFNFMMSYITSEIGDKSIINPSDLGGHYAGTADSANWHAAKGQQANTYLIKKNELGVTSMRVMDLLTQRALLGANPIATQINGADRTQAALGNELAFALNCSTSDSTAPDLSAAAAGADNLGTDGYAWAGGCDNGTSYGSAGKKIEASDLTNIIVPVEFSSHATAYGEKGGVCHMLSNLTRWFTTNLYGCWSCNSNSWCTKQRNSALFTS